MLLGENWRNPLISKFLATIQNPLITKRVHFYKRGPSGRGGWILLLTFPNPLHSGKWVTLYFGRSASALSRASTSSSTVGIVTFFLRTEAQERGSFSPRSSFVSYDFLSKNILPKLSHSGWRITSPIGLPDLAGRFPETTGYQKAQTYLIKQLEGIGITPIFQPFSITVRDIQECSLILYGLNRKEKLRAIPFRFF